METLSTSLAESFGPTERLEQRSPRGLDLRYVPLILSEVLGF